jgi:hypothetical protein
MIAGVALLSVAAIAVVLWVRSYWVSDWVLLLHRHAPGRITSVGVATFRGEVAAYYGGPNGSDYGDPRDTLVQYNPQQVRGVMIWPYRNLPEGVQRRWLGFGVEANARQRYYELVVPGWFVVVTTVTLGLLAARRARRLRRAGQIGLCPRCGYDVRATPDRCPECGTEITASPRSDRTPRESAAARPPTG